MQHRAPPNPVHTHVLLLLLLLLLQTLPEARPEELLQLLLMLVSP